MNGSFVWFRIGKGAWNCSSKITNNTVLFPDVRGDSDTPRHLKVADRYASELRGSGFEVKVLGTRPYHPTRFYCTSHLASSRY